MFNKEKIPLSDIILAAEFVRVRLGCSITPETEEALANIKRKAIEMCELIDRGSNDTTRKDSTAFAIKRD